MNNASLMYNMALASLVKQAEGGLLPNLSPGFDPESDMPLVHSRSPYQSQTLTPAAALYSPGLDAKRLASGKSPEDIGIDKVLVEQGLMDNMVRAAPNAPNYMLSQMSPMGIGRLVQRYGNDMAQRPQTEAMASVINKPSSWLERGLRATGLDKTLDFENTPSLVKARRDALPHVAYGRARDLKMQQFDGQGDPASLATIGAAHRIDPSSYLPVAKPGLPEGTPHAAGGSADNSVVLPHQRLQRLMDAYSTPASSAPTPSTDSTAPMTSTTAPTSGRQRLQQKLQGLFNW